MNVDDPVIRSAIYITVYRGKAFLPSLLRLPGKYGGFDESEPVYVADMTIEELVPLMNRVLTQGYPMRSGLNQDEIGKREKEHPLLKATGAKSWKILERKAVSYGVNWLEDKAELYASRSGSGEWDGTRTRLFSLDAALGEIAEAILSDYRRRGFWGWLRYR